jgi:hypothetical protein
VQDIDYVLQTVNTGRGFEAWEIAPPLQHVEPQHPPHKKQGDDTKDNVCHPLAAGFWFSEVEHWAIVAFRSATDFFRGRPTRANSYLEACTSGIRIRFVLGRRCHSVRETRGCSSCNQHRLWRR